MKKQDIEMIQKQLTEIKSISDKLDYNTSSAINQKLIKITPVLSAEYERMNTDNISINCPKLYLFTNREASEQKLTVADFMNKKLQELVVNGYKIIDFGKFDEAYNEEIDDGKRTIWLFIKYTS